MNTIGGSKAGLNETDPAASVPEGWQRPAFRPLAPKRKKTEIPIWIGILVIVAVVASIAMLCLRSSLAGNVFGAIGGLLAVAVLFGVALFVYFAPGIVAYRRKHRNREAIFICNLLFGWTFIGWGVTLVWALTANTEP